MDSSTAILISILFCDAIFIVIAYTINENNAKYLLSGYNTMSKDYKLMYIYLLCNLNDKENIWKGVTIKQNQWLFSNRTFALAVGVSIQKVRTFIEKLVNVERIMVEVVQLESKGFNNSQLLTWLL